MFALEKEMKAPVIRWLEDQELIIQAEFGNSWGVCDLAGCKFDLDKVAERNRLRQRTVKKCSDMFQYDWVPLYSDIIAVELKLDRYGEVINQALANRQFATESYIAMPREKALHVLNSGKWDIETLGILGITPDDVMVVRRGVVSREYLNCDNWAAEYFWRKYKHLYPAKPS